MAVPYELSLQNTPPGDGDIPGVACASDDTHSPAKNFKNNYASYSTWQLAENYDGVVFYKSPKFRVVVYPDHARFLIQSSVGTMHGHRQFEAFSYRTTKIVLKRLLHTHHVISTDRLMEFAAKLPKKAQFILKVLER